MTLSHSLENHDTYMCVMHCDLQKYSFALSFASQKACEVEKIAIVYIL